jgi:hypothetical protein
VTISELLHVVLAAAKVEMKKVHLLYVEKCRDITLLYFEFFLFHLVGKG